MHRFARGFADQLRRLLGTWHYRAMMALLLVGAWLAMDVYTLQVVTDLPVAIVDFDHSALSRTLLTYIDATREVEVVGGQVRSVAEAKRMLVEGEIAGLVLIPSSLSRDVKTGRPARLLVGVDMSNILVGKNVYKAISQSVATVSAGIQITVLRKHGETAERALASVVPIPVAEDVPFNPATNYSVYIVPGLLFFLLHIFVLLLACSVFRKEHWPGSIPGAIGALSAIFVVGLLLGLGVYYVYLPHVDIVSKSGWTIMVASLAAFLLAAVVLVASIHALIPKPFLALELTTVIGMLSLMFSGITWPTDMFPEAIARFSYFVPFTPFAQAFQRFLHHSLTWADLRGEFTQFGVQIVTFAGLILFGLALRAVLAAPKGGA